MPRASQRQRDYWKRYYAIPKNRERRDEYLRKWRREHPKYFGEYFKRRKATDPLFKLRCNLATQLWLCLFGKTKPGTTLSLVGCTLEDLKVHIEAQFLPGMTWENYGEGGWEIDHKVPCASFDFTKLEEVRRCFHWSNLQPMWATDNIKKSNKILPEYGNTEVVLV